MAPRCLLTPSGGTAEPSAPEDRAARWRSLSASVSTCGTFGVPLWEHPRRCAQRVSRAPMGSLCRCPKTARSRPGPYRRGARLASAARRLALYARDRWCNRPGCEMSPQWTDDLLRTGRVRPAFHRLFSVLVNDSTVSSPSLSNSDFKNGPASLASPWNSMSAR